MSKLHTHAQFRTYMQHSTGIHSKLLCISEIISIEHVAQYRVCAYEDEKKIVPSRNSFIVRDILVLKSLDFGRGANAGSGC